MRTSRTTVAIIGGGFTGAAIAFHLAGAEVDADILVFEPRARLGGGLAYGGDDPIHRVNVPASRMSLLPEDEGHFVRWLDATGALAGDAAARIGSEVYPQRREFGRYVHAALRPFVERGAVQHIRDRVVSLRKTGGQWRVEISDGRTFQAQLAAIATTHPEAAPPRELESCRGDSRLLLHPLKEGALRAVGRDDRVLIVGAGLTAADLVAGLAARGHCGPITMVSRRGLRSRGHPQIPFPPEGDFASAPAQKATELLKRIRRAVAAANTAGRSWHPVFDALRAQGSAIWGALAPDARRRVARHLRPYWDAHRFRIAPQIESVLNSKLNDGSLALRRARLGAVTRTDSGIAIEHRDLRRGATTTQIYDRILIATGPAHGDILRSQPFLQALEAQGALTLDATGLGLKTSSEGRAVGDRDVVDPILFIAGPLARGTFGELMGLPQVSNYARFVADQIAGTARTVGRREKAEA